MDEKSKEVRPSKRKNNLGQITKKSPYSRQQDKVLSHEQINKSVRMTQISKRSGPLPDADELKKYKEIADDLPNRIMKLAEDTAKKFHNFQMLRLVFESGLPKLTGFSLALVGLLSSYQLINDGKSTEGLTIFLVEALALGGLYFKYLTYKKTK